jgi:3-hydroxyisobutyrate dehydrogenase-like beta-hydroxyacid dehydrogenase
LPDTEIVKKVLAGRAGLLRGSLKPRYIIDTTTGDPIETKKLAGRLAREGIGLLDATISGSSKQILERKGVVMAGGDRKAYEACQDLLDTVAKKHFYIGPSGAGSKAKLASNLILGLNRLVLAEGLVFAECLGLDLEEFLSVLKATPAYSCAMDAKGEKMIREDFKPQSRVRQHRKDLSIIVRYGRKFRQELPLTRIHMEILDQIIGAGGGELDNAAVIQYIRQMKTNSTDSP